MKNSLFTVLAATTLLTQSVQASIPETKEMFPNGIISEDIRKIMAGEKQKPKTEPIPVTIEKDQSFEEYTDRFLPPLEKLLQDNSAASVLSSNYDTTIYFISHKNYISPEFQSVLKNMAYDIADEYSARISQRGIPENYSPGYDFMKMDITNSSAIDFIINPDDPTKISIIIGEQKTVENDTGIRDKLTFVLLPSGKSTNMLTLEIDTKGSLSINGRFGEDADTITFHQKTEEE